MIIIGSQAIKFYYPDFDRISKDIDVILNECGNNDLSLLKSHGLKIEYLENPILLEYYTSSNIYLEPNVLLTLKMSHMMWDINWEKHMWDIQFLFKKGHWIDKELFFKLYEYWNTIHSKNKRSDLKMSKEDFFNNAVNYNENEHDELHLILNPIPIYTKCFKEDKNVELDENKFHKLSYFDKLEFVREEVMVMAFERYKNLGYKRAYNKMLKKFIISHAPLFSIIFILENYIELQNCQRNFILEIENGIKNGRFEMVK